MVDSLFSESWYRVSDLRPRLRSHAQIHRHTYRGKDWYILQDHSSGRFHRFSQEAYHIIGLMDGKHTLGEIWEAACATLGDDMPTQEEVIQLVSQLHQADVLQTDMPPDIADLQQRHRRQKRLRLLGQFGSPFAVRFPIFDPERFLSATQFLVRPLYGWAGFLFWLLVVTSSLVLVGIHWEELSTNLVDRVLALENLFLLWLAYPVVKTLHEFGHAYSVKHWGGEVHEMGIMLLVFFPIPYVDASSTSAFREKHHRIMVGAAGIMTEAFLAALAVWVWVNVEPGVVRSLSFNVMIIAGVSTLLFNGNPLLRFDAYYILSDLLEIPNLGSRANRYIGYLLRRHLLKIEEVDNPASAPGEAPWLASYGLASFVYRIFIVIRIAMFVAGKFFALGVLLAAWGVFSILIMPCCKILHYAFTDSAMRPKRRRIILTGGIVIGLMTLIMLTLPIPSFTVAQGILWAPDKSKVYANADGIIKRVLVPSGRRVHRGDVLFICENPDLDAELTVSEAQLREYESRRRLSETRDRTEKEILTDEIERIKAELARKRSEREALVVRSQDEGVFLLPNSEDLPGRYVRRGTPMGYVIDFSKITAHVVVPQRDVDRVRTQTRRVVARLAEALSQEVPAMIKREVPAASSDLPSLALSLEGGGSLALDPREGVEPKAFEKLFHFEVTVSAPALKAIGERIFVRFEHDPEPLAFRFYRSLRRTLLRRFSV